MSTSGTFLYSPAIADLLLEAYERVDVKTTALTPEQISSGRRSLNLVLVSWSNRGVNLWTVAEFVQYLAQGTPQYIAPHQIIDVLADSVTLRQYLMGAPVSVAPQFTTTSGSSTVTVAGLAATPAAGEYINVGVMTSVGGLILDSFYQALSIPGTGQATITASANATSSTTGGVVPQFVSSLNSNTMTVNFPNHGLLIGQPFNVEITTTVGGVMLLGPYPVASVVNANQFTFTAPYPAGSVQTVSENSGLTSLATQATAQGLTQNSSPVDIQLYPLSRTEFMSIPNKLSQGRVTSFWTDRQLSPVLNFWPLPDGNGPYELRFRGSQQVEDAAITGGQTLAIPYRFLEAFTASLAFHLSMKWKPERSKDLYDYSEIVWSLAADEDVEKVSSWLTPDFSSYFN